MALDNLFVWLTSTQFPGSIVGLLILTAALQMRIVQLGDVKVIADFLISYMGFFFVPPGVALMLYFEIIKAEFWPTEIATVAST